MTPAPRSDTPSADTLRMAAEGARANAYCPYSNYPVGAALEAEDGRIFVGCNVENAAFPAGICAERSALASAVAAGVRKFRSVVIVSDALQPTPPCGVCRQALVEFAPALDVVSYSASGTARHWSMTDLLPAPFMPASLENA
ncbi:MAG: cytidine deaminase [Gemmatimonadota bacterium]|nr:cytidine deaminase [Gemmatimonadota bacterium]